MILVICSLVVSMFLLIGIFINKLISDTLEDQIGKRALNVAKSVALMPSIRDAFDEEDPAFIIQPVVEPIRIATEAEFIVVGNKDSIRYSHPLPERLGKKMVGGDNDLALIDGESYVSKAVGSLGPSLRRKVPIFSEDGEVIGLVSVGFLVEHIDTIVGNYEKEIWLTVIFFISFGVLGAIMIATHFKKLILGLEPEEIAQLFLEKEAILQSIHEGIIAIERNGHVSLINPAAQQLLSPSKQNTTFIGKHITEIIPNTKLLEVLQSGRSQFDHEMILGHHIVIVNRVPIFHGDDVVGVVASFRNKSEIDRLTQELSRIKQYVEALRAQTHEFSNKLYTLSGLLQLGKMAEAIKFINKESKIQQDWIHFLIREIKDPMISAVLLGKLNRASELGIEMTIDPQSSLAYVSEEQEKEVLLTILGNLIENALEAALVNKASKPEVKVFVTDLGYDLIFEVEDSGQGIPEDHIDKIFQDRFSTKKGTHRGIGLALVKQAINEVRGNIVLEEGELGGACFSVSIPQRNRGNKDVIQVSSTYYRG